MNRKLWNVLAAASVVLALTVDAEPGPRKAAHPVAKKPVAAKPQPARAVPLAAAPRPAVVRAPAKPQKGFHAPDAYFVLQKEVSAALLARDLEKAEATSHAQMLLRPDRPLPYYNLATVHALRGHLDKAAESLSRAQDRNFGFPELLSVDPDLAALRTHSLWPQLMQRAQAISTAVEVAANPTNPVATP